MEYLNTSHKSNRSVAQLGRAPVSKTGGCRFDSCHSCSKSKNELGIDLVKLE